jgi:hypothetical protein
MYSQLFSIIIGIIIVICLNMIFCKNIKYSGPNAKQISVLVFSKNNKLYKLQPIVHICPV